MSYVNHTTLDCKREPFWNVGPELCAAQVTNQSFFFIDENIDPKVSREKASTAIITMVSGEATAKQIESVFKSVVSSDQWKWTARRLADNKFTMRFPSAKMILDYSNFNLGVKNGNVQFTIKPWTSAMGAKGQLQQAWFKVKGIPIDQRGLRTIAKIGGLVGKTMVIDEHTRFNRDFVRIKIACRNVDLVPHSAESNLGLYIYDFIFEREVEEFVPPANQSAITGVDIPESQPSPKKQRTEVNPTIPGTSIAKANTSGNVNAGGNYIRHSFADGEVTVKNVSSVPGMMARGKDIDNLIHKVPLDILEVNNDQHKKKLVNPSSDEEVIPAATYEPNRDVNEVESGESSDEYEIQVNNVLGDRCESSKRREDFWFARCESMATPKMVQQIKLDGMNAKKSTVFLFEQSDTPMESTPTTTQADVSKMLLAPTTSPNRTAVLISKFTESEDKDAPTCEKFSLNLKKLENPCNLLKMKRCERRASERPQMNLSGEGSQASLDSTKKRSLEGNTIPISNSFSALDDDELIKRSNCMGVVINSSDFTAVELLKDLENARHALNKKLVDSNIPSEDQHVNQNVIEDQDSQSAEDDASLDFR